QHAHTHTHTHTHTNTTACTHTHTHTHTHTTNHHPTPHTYTTHQHTHTHTTTPACTLTHTITSLFNSETLVRQRSILALHFPSLLNVASVFDWYHKDFSQFILSTGQQIGPVNGVT